MDPAQFVVGYLVFLFSTTCHEAAHAYLAYKGGDSTAYLGGHVTLDPIPHIKRSPFGMVVVPLLGGLFGGLMIGWASVPIDPHWARRHPTRAAFMSLAGPMTNLLLAVIAFIAIKVWLDQGTFNQVAAGSPLAAARSALLTLLTLNVALALLNLIPFPPLDGAGVAEGFSPRTAGSFYEKLRENQMFQLLGLVLIWQLFPRIVDPVLMFVYDLLGR
jgi:Zn-dependent protease